MVAHPPGHVGKTRLDKWNTQRKFVSSELPGYSYESPKWREGSHINMCQIRAFGAPLYFCSSELISLVWWWLLPIQAERARMSWSYQLKWRHSFVWELPINIGRFPIRYILQFSSILQSFAVFAIYSFWQYGDRIYRGSILLVLPQLARGITTAYLIVRACENYNFGFQMFVGCQALPSLLLIGPKTARTWWQNQMSKKSKNLEKSFSTFFF